MLCKSCGSNVNQEVGYCLECGSSIKADQFEDSEIKKEYQAKLKEFINNVDDLSNYSEEAIWNKTANKYVNTMNKMRSILKNENIEDYATEGLFRNLDTFVEKCKIPEFHIAFVGAIKAGKSTLINAFLGRDLASISVTPETAALTKFRASKTKDYIKLKFYNRSEWQELWKSVENSDDDETFKEEYFELNAKQEEDKLIGAEDEFLEFDDEEELIKEIEKWTSSKQATHYFVKEVEVGLKDFNVPEQVVFIDTPGLDDPVEYRSDITRKYIDKANAVLVCIRSDAMTGQELATVYSVFANTRYNPEKVYIVGTQLDKLNSPIQDWREQRQEWLKHLKRDDCFGSFNLADKNLVVSSAYLYSLLKDYDDLDDDIIDFKLVPIARNFEIRDLDSNIDKLKEFTNIDKLKLKLKDEIVSKYEKILLDDLKHGYLNNKEDLLNFFKNIKEEQGEILAAADDNIEEIRRKRKESLEKLEESKQEKKELKEVLKGIKRFTTKKAKKLCRNIENMAEEI